MSGRRIDTANNVVKAMLSLLPKTEKSTYNIYNFNTSAWSVIPGGQSLGYDDSNVSTATNQLKTNASGGTDINAALTTVFNQRDKGKPRCSVIVITDGLDWGITAAMQTVQKNFKAAAAVNGDYSALRVFVMGLGDDVSRGMCEALVRAGAGATVYISESNLRDRDKWLEKARNLIISIGYAPISVSQISWGIPIRPRPAVSSGNFLSSRPQPDYSKLGAAAKGDNLPEPNAIQTAPNPGTMFWAVRSYWYAIIDGIPNPGSKATIAFTVGSGGTRRLEVEFKWNRSGRLIHSLAARALIQMWEDRAASITNSTEKYFAECEIVRLGKTYSLASTQTSFVATMNGVGTTTRIVNNAAPGQNLLSGLDLSDISSGTNLPPATGQVQFNVSPFNTFATTTSSQSFKPKMRSLAAPTMDLAASAAGSDASSVVASAPSAGRDDLSEIIAAQDGNGAFDSRTVEQIVFPTSGIPAVPPFISILEGRESVKDQIWLAICVIAFFKNKYAGRSSEWSIAQSKAENFVKTTLCCIFGVDSTRSESIFTKSLQKAEGNFY